MTLDKLDKKYNCDTITNVDLSHFRIFLRRYIYPSKANKENTIFQELTETIRANVNGSDLLFFNGYTITMTCSDLYNHKDEYTGLIKRTIATMLYYKYSDYILFFINYNSEYSSKQRDILKSIISSILNNMNYFDILVNISYDFQNNKITIMF